MPVRIYFYLNVRVKEISNIFPWNLIKERVTQVATWQFVVKEGGILVRRNPNVDGTNTKASNVSVVSLIARLAEEKLKFYSFVTRYFCHSTQQSWWIKTLLYQKIKTTPQLINPCKSWDNQ